MKYNMRTRSKVVPIEEEEQVKKPVKSSKKQPRYAKIENATAHY